MLTQSLRYCNGEGEHLSMSIVGGSFVKFLGIVSCEVLTCQYLVDAGSDKLVVEASLLS